MFTQQDKHNTEQKAICENNLKSQSYTQVN